ncbi:supporter of activation of yellow protein isoform X2 [Anopheles coustani]|uniref:supporter of activation of yellow protein isoform X2 n=1 Tax=Anopheles coustani TaxID=139045 RepID=UPI0026580457|nr:supporter of activation of yellow protein isoform X2 [Anopheles coustani]
MNCAENEPQEIDGTTREGQKQQVVVATSDLFYHQHPRKQEAAGVDSSWATNVNTVGGRGDSGGTYQRPDPSEVENETELLNHHVGASGSTIYLTADGNGEVHLGTTGEAEARSEEEDSRRRRKNFTMRDPQESHHRLPLGEVESGDDSDCVVVAAPSERKVEPLKINLARDREPIRTIIKLTPGTGGSVLDSSSCSQQLSPTIREVPGSPKITIKPPKPPPPSTMEGPGGGGGSSSSSIGSTNQNSNSVLSQPSTSTTALPNSSSIPKLTIKPVINPAEELLTVEAPAEQMQIIPKLLIKGSSLDASIHGVTEPHIVPKLTIRGVNNHNHHFHHHNHQHHPPESQSQSTGDGGTGTQVAGASASGSPTTPSTPLVPKLTIKMDNHHPHHHHHVQQSQQHNNLRMKDVADAGSGGSGNRVESPIPKLHIKAILPEAGGSCSTQSPPSIGGSGSNVLVTPSVSGNSLTSSEGVKLTIKPLPEPKLPKLTIKTTGLGTIAETSDASMVSSTSCSFSPKMMPAGMMVVGGGNSHDLQHHYHHHQQHNQIQLLTVAQQQPASPSDQHSSISSSSIPKITIKPIPAKLGLQQQQSPTGSAAGNASMAGADLPQTVPRLTIKPIPPPPTDSTKQSTGEDSNSSSETSINSLESSPVSSSCSSSSVATSAVITTSPSTLRMTIKVSPQQDASSASTTSSSTVTKLNIKPILPPPFPNPTGEANEPGADEVSPPSEGEVDPSAAPIVIPKVTIKTLANPRSQETEILSTPKVTLKPIPKPTGHELLLPGSPAMGQSAVERHSPQAQAAANSISHAALNSNNSPTAGMTASDGGGSMDSPRIILKINKGSSSTTTTSLEQQQPQSDGMDTTESSSISHPPPMGGSSILANELKRPAANAAANSITPFSSSSSSASSTTVSISTSSSSAGSDPASPSSSAGGGDQGEPGSPDAKKSKLELVAAGVARVAREQQKKFIPHQLSEHNAALRQSLLENHQQQQQQLLQKAQQQQTTLVGAGGQPPVADVIVIDDDSKSENESSERAENEKPAVDSSHEPTSVPELNLMGQDPASLRSQPMFAFMSNNEATTIEVVKPRRTRGTSRGAGGGRQSRRGAGGGRGAVAKQQPVVTEEAPRLNLPELLVNHDDNDEGSSSDCMIVDDPSATTTTISSVPTARSGLSLESLLLGGGGIKQPGLYNATHAGGSNELEKNGTASNSSIGSVSSSIGSTPIPAASPATTTPGVRMSTRRGAGQLLKEVLANKHHDRDSGVDDEARTDGESGPHLGGPTPSKRPRGRPKKQSVDLTMETNGTGGSSSSLEGNGGTIPDSNMMMALAMMSGGAGGAEGVTFLRPDGPGMLGTQQLMEGIMPLPITPVRTPRTRGRGRGRGRGKLALLDGATVAQSPNLDPLDASRRNFALPPGVGGSGGNGDPLFIDPAADPTSFNLLFNHAVTPRGAGSVRTRGGRRGVGSRGARTPRGGGRGAAKAARAALLLANTPIVGQISPEANEEGIVEPNDPLESPKSQPSGDSPSTGTPVGGRGRARAPRGSGTASKRNATASGRKAPRGKKAQEAAALLAAAEAAASPKNAINPANASNTIFMTPMAGGLDLNRPRLHVRELKTPKNAIKSNTPPSSAQTTPLAGPTPAGTPGETTPGDGGLQVFEEDTRMSGDFNFTTPVRLMMSSGDGCLQPNEESQSSYLSSTSVTQDATGASATGGQPQPPAGAADGLVPASASSTSDAQKDSLVGAISAGNSNSSSSRRPKGKMEVLDAHRAAFTVELLAEYEWPRPSPGTRGTDTFMLQEQIAEYLGVKSFKRKYPDLMRRPVDMEERNFLLEQGLASEKMCDLGLTAVYASEILDIMCSDYPEKYEEYTRYTREKHFRELSIRQQRQQLEAFTSNAATPAVAAVPIDRVKLQKEKAIESAASWNSSFNRERRDTRRACMDLQTYVVQVPKRYQSTQAQSKAKSEGATNYPVALVPGQFSEYYTTYTPEELACYPINTILLDPEQLKEIVSSERYRRLVAAEEARLQESDDDSSSSSSSSGGSSDEDSDTSSSSSSDEDDDGGISTDSSCSSSSAQSSTFSDCDHCDASGVKKELDRRKRTGMSVDCEKNDDISITAASGPPVRRSSRALSAGTVVGSTLVVETKDPTDSDDSDVPLIAHAVRKKNLQSSTNAAAPPHPSAGGGKRMQENMSPVKRPPLDPFMCAVCLGPENKNRYSKPERFVRCNRCRRKAHPSCIGMSSVMYRRVQQYKWQCSECKLCMKCNRCPLATDSKMVYCDQCDRGYHLACKGLRNLPEGRWQCSICTICGQCGARTPEGHPNPHLNAQQRQHLAMVAEWTHEYGVNELTKIREHLRTLCVPCVRQRRQRLPQPDQTSPIATVVQQDPHGGGGSPIVSSNCETKAILNNNNNPSDQRKQPQPAQPSLPVQRQGVAVGGMSDAGAAGSIKPQSQQYMINSTTIKQQPPMMIVQTGSGIPNSHVHSGTKGGTMIGGAEVRR